MAALRKYNRKGGVIYFVDFVYQGKRFRKSTKTSDRKLAELFLKDIEVKIARDNFGFDDLKSKQIRLSAFFEKYLQFSKATKAYNTFELDKHSQSKFREYTGDIELRKVSPQLIEEYKLYRLNHVKATTVNIEFRHLKAAFEKAVTWKHIQENPFKQVKQFKIKGNNFPKYLTKQQVQSLLNVIPDEDFRNLIQFYLYTGCRRQETLNVKWQDVDLKSRKIQIHETKSGKSRIVPINSRLLKVLEKLPRQNEHLFSYTKWHVTHKFKEYLNALEIPNGSSLSLHSLRHTFASHLVMEGVDLYTVAKLLGHSSVAVTQMYAHLAPNYLQVSIDRLDFKE